MKTLTITLEQQLKQLEELQLLLNSETNELAEVHLDALAQINRQKEELSVRIEAQAATLQRELEEINSKEGLPAKTSLGELAARFSTKGMHELSKLHAKLNHTAEQVKQALALNREIAERFSSSIGLTLDLMSRIMNQSNTYGASGGYKQSLASAVMINRKV
jgi:flagellar biosynthesis/type III secretory pathway chaperone